MSSQWDRQKMTFLIARRKRYQNKKNKRYLACHYLVENFIPVSSETTFHIANQLEYRLAFYWKGIDLSTGIFLSFS